MNASPPPQALAAAVNPRPTAAHGWRGSLLLLAAILVPLGLAFAEEGQSAIRVWETSTAYNHCWLILPIAFWLAWQRRFRLVGLAPAPSPWLALLAIPPAFAWLAAERLGIMEGRQLAALVLLEVVALAVLGWRVFRAFAAPLLYLIFLVPFGAFAVPWLQHITAAMIEVGLTVAGVPHYMDDLLIEIPAGSFLVAEACAGLRFLIAALAFGALYAAVMFRSPGRRLLVMLLALVVPIIANGIRAFGIVMLGHWLGSAEAAAADHVIYGWVFFSLVILLLIVAGLPFREDHDGPAPLPAPPPAPAARPRALAVAATLVLGIALAGPGAALALQRGGQVREVPARLAAIPGCTAAADGLGLDCQGVAIAARLVAFPTRTTWSGVASASLGAFAGTDDDVTFNLRQPGVALWRARQSRSATGAVATGIWIDGQPQVGGLRSRLDQARRSIGTGSGRPVLAVITLQPSARLPGGSQAERSLLTRVLEAQGTALAAEAAARSVGR